MRSGKSLEMQTNELPNLDAIAVARGADAGRAASLLASPTEIGVRRPYSALLVAGQLGGQLFGIVDLAQRLDDAGRMDRQGAGLFVAEGEIQGQRLNVAVENQAHHFRLTVDD